MNSIIIIPTAILIETLSIRAISSNWSSAINLLSIQIRLAAYIFLRWIPARHLPTAIPSAFLIYCFAWSRQKSRSGFHLIQEEEEEPEEDDVDQEPPADEPQQSTEQQNDSAKVVVNSASSTISSSSTPHEPSNSTKSKKNKKSKSKVTETYRFRETDSLLPKRVKKPTQTDCDQSNNSFANLIKSIIGFTSSSSLFNLITFLTNLVLTLFCLDATFRTVIFHGHEDLSFSRVGAIGETWAKVHVRIPPIDPEGAVLQDDGANLIGAKLVFRPMKPIGSWILGPSLITSNRTDWSTVGNIDKLLPGKAYEYRLNSLKSFDKPHHLFQSVGHFQTAPDSSLISNPQKGGGSFTFAYSSCIKPGFPYNPFRHPLQNDGAEQLADFAQKLKLDFVLFLGDFIYIDSPIYLGNSISHYWRKYRQSLATEGWRKLMQFTRTIHIYDDHEIYNDWAGKGNDTNEIFQPANQAYRDYLGDANFDGPGKGKNYYWFRYGDAGFFVWDCRRYRSSNDQVDDQFKTMLGLEQKQVFLNWLSAVNSTVTFKFVVSSTPFMSLWSGPDGGIDTWAGFLTERSELMDVMQYVPNLIILSGDRHEFAAASIRESVIEFSTSPLNQFWLPIRTLSQENGLGKIGEDKLLKYIPNGSHKFSTLNVDCRDPKKPLVNFKLFIDEKLSWELKYLGKPVKEEPKQLGQLLPTWEQLLKLLPPIKWFSDQVSSSAPLDVQTNENHEDEEVL